MFDSFNNCLIFVRYGFNLVFVVRMVLDVRLNWLYDVKKVQPHPIIFTPKNSDSNSDQKTNKSKTNIHLMKDFSFCEQRF